MSPQRIKSGGNPAIERVDMLATEQDKNRLITAYRVVQAGILATLVWKISFFSYANAIYNTIEISDSFFPDLLRSPSILRVSFLGATAATLLNMLATSNAVRKGCCITVMLGLSILCIHQGSYNDMTFVTAWWCATWSCWVSYRIDQDSHQTLLQKSAFLARAMISMIILGGAVGKWTGEYWSGQVLYDIYFVDRDFWLFNYLRDTYSEEELKVIATWHSRNVVMIETAFGLFYWLLGNRVAAIAGIFILCSIAIFSNFLLFSVLSCLIALSAVGYFASEPAERS